MTSSFSHLNDECDTLYVWMNDFCNQTSTKKRIKIVLTKEKLEGMFIEDKEEMVKGTKKNTTVTALYEANNNELAYNKLCRLISVLDYCGECESEMSNVFAEYIESKIISRIESLTKIVEDHFIDLGYGKKDEFYVTFVVK